MNVLYSLRQHDLDQVIRVERGSLLSVPHRRTPRSIVSNKYTLISEIVNSKTKAARTATGTQAESIALLQFSSARVDAIPLSFEVHEDLPLNPGQENQ